jgi:predicted RNA-binding protein with PIN domain
MDRLILEMDHKAVETRHTELSRAVIGESRSKEVDSGSGAERTADSADAAGALPSGGQAGPDEGAAEEFAAEETVAEAAAVQEAEPAEAAAEEPAAEAPAAEEPELLGPLAEPVRLQVVALAAETVGLLPSAQVPVSLRPFAKFTPVKRAKLAATPLAAALEADPVFRERIADRLRLAFPQIVESLEQGRVPAAAEPRDVAAIAYVLRPGGWPQVVEQSGQAAAAAERTVADEHLGDEVARLKTELDLVREHAKHEVERMRAELAGVHREEESLRRRIRQLEADMRRAQHAARLAQAEAAQAHTDAETAVSRAESDLRRARARATEAESALDGVRRGAREQRSADEVRLRLLLETISEAATGLRRELALSPTDQRPADSVDAVRPQEPGTGDIPGRARESDDPAVLDALLSLPRVHLVVDGYNVTKTGYPSLSLHEQRVRLLRGLGAVAARTGAEVTCVFDGAQLGGPVPVPRFKGVRVLFSNPGEIADELIRRLVAAEPQGRPLVVVSSDREVAEGVRRSGARPVPALMLVKALARG